MKKLLWMTLALLCLAACNGKSDEEKYAYRTQCPKDEMYHKHNFRSDGYSVASPKTELGYTGWIDDTCVKCGLMRRYNLKLTCPDVGGLVVLYKSPLTGKYDDLCVQTFRDGVDEITPIKENQIKPKDE